jgi:hypothetical protein
MTCYTGGHIRFVLASHLISHLVDVLLDKVASLLGIIGFSGVKFCRSHMKKKIVTPAPVRLAHCNHVGMPFADFIEEIGLVAWNTAVEITQPGKSIVSCSEKKVQLDTSALKYLHESDRLVCSDVSAARAP